MMTKDAVTDASVLTAPETAPETEQHIALDTATTVDVRHAGTIQSINAESQTGQCLQRMEHLYKRLMEGDPVEDHCEDETVSQIQEILTKEKNSLSHSRTANLWLQYMDMIDTLQGYIRGERLSNFPWHLHLTKEMLWEYAASGHNNHLKSSYMYYQDRIGLEQSHPDIHHHFMNGLHIARRSDGQWAGLSCDLVIESCLMRNLKTSGGLTYGSCMSEAQRTL